MSRRRIAFFAFIATGLGVASPAMASVPGPCQKIVNYNSGQCMAVAYGNIANGSPIIQWPCTGTPDQYWSVLSEGILSEIRNCSEPNSVAYCLSVTDTNEGSQLVLTRCDVPRDGISWPQAWEISSFSDGGDNASLLTLQYDGYLAAVSLGGGPGAGTTQGTGIIQWADQISGPFDHEEQQWIFE